ncbi:hypothetical protein [Kitasatospora cathayae]|uniref:Uncharacterized protein n=1 Tax=Kitasatospora cathayae TaxID=3004092 RepID=A0ABY7QIV4_9ACTN|nr:hypothetical protein [Kitasatospora sp. HUAS 3-15]WBP92185.1 hypothetical protein O1G21_40975 [Kitasatospora sp. HUAS 3-15]
MKTLLASRPVSPLTARRIHLLLGLAGMLWMLGVTLPVPVRLVLVPVVAVLLYLQGVAEADAPVVTVRTPRTTGPTGGAR